MDNGKQVKNDNYAADIASIREARVRIAPYIHETPVLTSKSLDSIASKRLYFKLVTMLQQWLWLQSSVESQHMLSYRKMLQNARLRMSGGMVVKSSGVNQRSNQERVLLRKFSKILVQFWFILSTIDSPSGFVFVIDHLI
ncbi:hypothetical protein ZIOFF_065974 [Zingiber officinale]|uniref:Uncharacterized protein n=1 Tax=Zingiber officinale TaxID=94328 RepID=A0A8J5F0X0_ZINOF|nr:hypothetical protein ZIOFF_065974 [Zingiber officinale]